MPEVVILQWFNARKFEGGLMDYIHEFFASFGIECHCEGGAFYIYEGDLEKALLILEAVKVMYDVGEDVYLESKCDKFLATSVTLIGDPDRFREYMSLFRFWVSRFRGAKFNAPSRQDLDIFITKCKRLGARVNSDLKFWDDYKAYISGLAFYLHRNPYAIGEQIKIKPVANDNPSRGKTTETEVEVG